MVTSSLRRYHRPRGPYTTTKRLGHNRIPSSCRLRPTSRHHPFPHCLGSSASLGLVPFSAIIIRRDTQPSNSVCSPSTGFRNLSTGLRPRRLVGLFHPTGTPRVGPSEVTSRLIGCRSRHPRLLHRYAPFMVSFRMKRAVPTTWPPRSYPVTTRFSRPLVALQRPASILGFGRPWSFAPSRARFVQQQVSPCSCDSTSLGLFLLPGVAL